MKREGRQHGMVQTYPLSYPLSAAWDPRPKPRGSDGLYATLTAGSFAKVSTKPTNHSKFTGKCGQTGKCGRAVCPECRVRPTSKSKDKAKGTQRFGSSSEVVLDYKLIPRRVVDATPSFKLSGFSAVSVLDYLDDDEYMDDEERNGSPVEELEYEISYPSLEIEANDNWINGEDHEDLSFSEFVWQLEDEDEDEDEDWCLV